MNYLFDCLFYLWRSVVTFTGNTTYTPPQSLNATVNVWEFQAYSLILEYPTWGFPTATLLKEKRLIHEHSRLNQQNLIKTVYLIIFSCLAEF